ncbi:hypothetical protein Hamer_G020733 [Homarus americanus]|uniref:Uncharacterized protein n=1 Tax=Homarus americanus TaxID=6706 RepID=A0A8J5MTW9_HOMAM|nr:hypothetical protein Hamer_G020733 [Homarus americanus]
MRGRRRRRRRRSEEEKKKKRGGEEEEEKGFKAAVRSSDTRVLARTAKETVTNMRARNPHLFTLRPTSYQNSNRGKRIASQWTRQSPTEKSSPTPETGWLSSVTVSARGRHHSHPPPRSPSATSSKHYVFVVDVVPAAFSKYTRPISYPRRQKKRLLVPVTSWDCDVLFSHQREKQT